MGKKKASPKPAAGAGEKAARQLPDWAPHVAGLALVACAVYANSLTNGFVIDDKFQLLNNPTVTDIRKIPQVLGSSVWSFMGFKGNYYRPLQFLVYMLLYQGFGFSAAAFHLAMVALHAVNTVLVYFLVRRVLVKAMPALAAAALFAVHPIHTEVVDWVAALPDLMMTTLVLLAVGAFVRQGGAPRKLQIVGHCGFYLLALLTKETGAMLLPLYVGYEWLCLGRPLRELRRNALLYAGLAAAFGIYAAMRVTAMGTFAPAQQMFFHLGPLEFALSVVVTAAQYFGTLVWPGELNYYHMFHPTGTVTPGLVVALVTLAGLAFATLRFRGRAGTNGIARPALVSYGVFWIAVSIAPAMNLTGVGQNVFAERYLYLPSVGFAWIAGLAFEWAVRKRPQWAWTVAGVVLLVCSVTVVARNADWKDDFTLLQVTLRQSPESGYLRNYMAGAYIDRDQFGLALEEQRLAVRYEPRSAVFHKNLGNILLGTDPAAAVKEFEEVLRIQPGLAEIHYDLGLAWNALHDTGKAAAAYERALALRPNYTDALLGLADLDASAGKAREAIDLCRRAAVARPADPGPYARLAELYNTLGQYTEAVPEARRALELAPRSDRAFLTHYALGIAYTHTETLEAAATEFETAYRLRPQFETARQAYESTMAKLRAQGK